MILLPCQDVDSEAEQSRKHGESSRPYDGNLKYLLSGKVWGTLWHIRFQGFDESQSQEDREQENIACSISVQMKRNINYLQCKETERDRTELLI